MKLKNGWVKVIANNDMKLKDKLIQEDGFYSIDLNDTDIEDVFSLLRKDKSDLNKLFKDIFYKYRLDTSRLPNNQEFTKFIFRGQADKDWPLKPAYFRLIDDQKLEYSARSENEYFNNFIDACDLANVQLPSDSLTLRKQLKELYEAKNPLVKNSWITPEYYELFAFAQHYGLKTRLLDWSHNPLVALYFACSGALKSSGTDSKFSLWIMCTDSIETVKDLKVIDVPKALNQHISYQQGCFTFVEQYPAERNDPKVQAIYKKLKPETDLSTIRIYNETDILHRNQQDYILLRININYSDAKKCFEYCNGFNINAATLYRGQKGAVLHSEDIFAYKKKAL